MDLKYGHLLGMDKFAMEELTPNPWSYHPETGLSLQVRPKQRERNGK